MRFTIRKKLIGGFLSVLLLLGGIVGIGNFEISKIDSMYSKMLDGDAKQVSTIYNYKAELFKQSNAVSAFLLSKDDASMTTYSIAFSKFTKPMKMLEDAETDPTGQKLLEKMRLAQNQYLQIVNKEIDLKKANETDAYISLATTDAKLAGDNFQAAAENVVKFKTEKMKNDRDDLNQQIAAVKNTILAISVLALIVGISVAFVVSHLLSKPVIAVADVLKKLADGDLTVSNVKVRSKDEVGLLSQALNQLLHNLKELIGKVYDSSVQVASASEQMLASNEQSTRAAEQIASAVQHTASGSEQQLNYFEEASSSVQEMAAGIQQIAESSESMLHSTENATNLTRDGAKSVESVVSHMHEINVSFEETSKIVSNLGSRSQEINGIASLITSIAEQTNLLALNAAIEAARAGEHGKGFAVVADEVRKLAEQSKNSAVKIASMIHFVQKETEQAIEAVQSGNNLVEKGLLSTQEAHNAFVNISSSIEDVSYKVHEVSSAVEELTAQSKSIVGAIENVKGISEEVAFANQESSAATEEQVATMEEVTSSALGLTRLAEELQSVVSQFKL
ncbi:MAG: methyl-accepting chemotaxis protein [Bacillota bacterium]|nr:methyl-accepting chemotaxis protein [Bacillota bacterium]